jgi:hypothetical protein
MQEQNNILQFTTSEFIALDRVLQQIKEAVKANKRSTTISLTNKYFVEMILSVASKRLLSDAELSALAEELKKLC